MTQFCSKHPELWKFIKFNITVIVTSALDIISYLIFLYIVFAKYNTTPLQGNSILSFLGIQRIFVCIFNIDNTRICCGIFDEQKNHLSLRH